MPEFSLSSASRVKPFRGIFGAGPEIRRVPAHLSSVGLVQHPAKLRIHILSVMAVNNPLRNTVLLCHLQIINVGKAVDIDPDCLIFMGVSDKKGFQLPAESQGIPSPGSEMDRPAAHGMDLILKGYRIIGIAQKVKMKPGAVDPAVIIHQKALHPARVLCHTKNKDIKHSQTPAFHSCAYFASIIPQCILSLWAFCRTLAS